MNSFASSRLLNIMIIGWWMRRPRIFWLQSYFIFTPHTWEFWFFNFFAIIIFQYRISYEKPMDLNWIMHHFFLAVFKILFSFIIFFSFIFVSWRLITPQHCSGFCHALTWISHGFTCIPHPDPPSHLPLYLIPLGLPSAPGLSTCIFLFLDPYNLIMLYQGMVFCILILLKFAELLKSIYLCQCQNLGNFWSLFH